MVNAHLRPLPLPHRFAWGYILLFSLTNAPAQTSAQDPAVLQQRLERAAALTSLDLPATRPWHLKLSLSTTDATQPAIQETVEQWWAAPEQWRTEYTNAAGAVTSEIRNSEGRFRTKGAPRVSNRDRMLLREVVDPLPQHIDLEKVQLALQPLTLSGRSFDCIAVSRLSAAPKGLTSAPETRYCFESGSDIFRTVYPTPYRIIARVTRGKFQGRDVSMELQDRNGADRLTIAKLIELKAEVPDPAKLTPDSSMEQVPERVTMAGGVTAGRKIGGQTPQYPLAAKMSHISGQVILSAVISKDGGITDLEAESSPSNILTQAAINAVKTWRYEPYLLGGSPVEVETTITVNFNIGF